jgi:hypothetical protein
VQLNIAILPAIIFSSGVFLVIMANVVFYSILGEVNGKRSEPERISMFFVGPKLLEIMKIHKDLFPRSRKRLMAIVLAVCGIVTILGIFISITSIQ